MVEGILNVKRTLIVPLLKTLTRLLGTSAELCFLFEVFRTVILAAL